MAEGSNIPAVAIAQRLLDITGEALLAGDFDKFKDCFTLPTRVSSPAGQVNIDTEDKMRALFTDVSEGFRSRGVTKLVRYSLNAEYLSGTRISSVHETNIMSGAIRLEEPYPTYSILDLQEDGDWRVSYSDYAMPADTHQARPFHVATRAATGQKYGENDA